MPDLHFDEATLAQARRFNRILAWAPRFSIRNRAMPLLVQGLLRLSQAGAGRKLARAGIRVERAIAQADGGSVPLRILRGAGPVRGVVLDIHGGGWVIGNAAMDDDLNAALVATCDVAVVSVDYRLFGRTPLQGLMDDCLVAARWLLADGLPEYRDLPVFFVGESAGGHLAAATLLRLKAWPALLGQVAGAVLYYGVYDITGTPSVRSACPATLVLDGPGMVSALARLVPGANETARRTAPLSPLYGDLAGLPPALMFAGTADPLRDDTTAMAQRWRQVADVKAHLVPDAPHGFIRFPTRMAGIVQAHTQAWLRARIAAGVPSEGEDRARMGMRY